MANEVNIYTPRYLAEVVRQAPPVHTYFRDTFFTNIKTFPTECVDIDLVKGDRRKAACYKPPLINLNDLTTADRLMTRLPGEDMYSGKKPAERAAEKLMDEYNRLNDAATRREEWMAAQAILMGKISIVRIGVNELIDFGFTNKITLTGSAKWDTATSTMLDNLGDWVDRVLINGFTNVDRAIFGRNAIRLLLADEDVQKRLDNRCMNIGEIAARDLPNDVRYYGHLNDPNLDLYGYEDVYLDDWTDPENPETKPLVPDNDIILAPSNPGFMRLYGACTYIDDAGAWVTAETARLLRSYVKHGPDRRFLELQTRPLPVPDKMDSWLVATVC